MKLTRKFSRYIDRKYPQWDVSIALRYLPIAKDIQKKIKKGDKILDVGSGEFGIATYLDGYKIVGTDIDFGEERSRNFKLVKASAENLPFKKDSFTATISVDTLEHLSEKIRRESVEEMVRVSKDYLYIAFPRGNFSSLIDRFISRYYELTHKEKSAYLEEHLEHGLPNEKKIAEILKKSAKKYGKKVSIRTRGNTNSFLWLFLLMLGFSQLKPLTYIYHKMVLLTPILRHLNTWPTYRVIIYAEFI